MPYIIVTIENFDIKNESVQEKIKIQFPRETYATHLIISKTILNKPVIHRRSEKVSLFFYPHEICAVSFSSLRECAKGLDEFFKWAKDEKYTNIAMEMSKKGDVAQSPSIIILVVPLLTYILGSVFGHLSILLRLILGVVILVGLVLYYLRSDLTFKLLKWRYDKKWR
ncbi:hypothetical protein M1N57_01465 [Dehalococcoidales bacterium]|nr:hypothetical protein [Dehalococcoidales bacterium]